MNVGYLRNIFSKTENFGLLYYKGMADDKIEQE